MKPSRSEPMRGQLPRGPIRDRPMCAGTQVHRGLQQKRGTSWTVITSTGPICAERRLRKVPNFDLPNTCLTLSRQWGLVTWERRRLRCLGEKTHVVSQGSSRRQAPVVSPRQLATRTIHPSTRRTHELEYTAHHHSRRITPWWRRIFLPQALAPQGGRRGGSQATGRANTDPVATVRGSSS